MRILLWLLSISSCFAWPQLDSILLDSHHFYSKPVPSQYSSHPKAEATKQQLSGLERASQYLLNSVDPKVDPCKDFYNYACGNWKKKNKIPSYQSATSHYSLMQERVFKDIQQSLSSPNKNELNSSAVEQARMVYKACMNQEQINKVGTSELRKELARISDWPLINLPGEKETEYLNLTDLLINIYNERAKESLFSVSRTVNQLNSTEYLLAFEVKSQLLSAPEFYFDEKYLKIMDALEETLLKMAKLVAKDAGVEVNEKELNEDIREVLVFDTKLALIKYGSATKSRTKKNVLQLNLSAMRFISPLIEWEKYVEVIWPKDILSYLEEDPIIYILNTEEFYQFTELLLTTEPSTIINYILMSYVYQRSTTLDERFQELHFNLDKVTSGATKRQPRDEKCTIYVWSLFPLAVDLLYIRNHFDVETKNRVEEVVKQIHGVFDEVIEKNDWMDTATKHYASKKLEKMKVFVGFSPLMNDTKCVDNLTKSLALKESDTFDQMLVKISKFGQRRYFHRLTEKYTPENNALDASEVNAEYNFHNFVTIPSAILQSPLFEADFPKVFVYAGLGYILGHEFSHAFDETGSQYDVDGNTGVDWWSTESRKKFNTKANCFIDQYSNYTIDEVGLRVNGNLTVDENIADAGGLKIAYKTYKQFVTETPTINGFEHLNADQVFFLAFGASECNNERKESLISDILEDEHTPEPARVNGVVSNIKEFAEAFNCPVNAPLNPGKRCSIW